MKTRFKKNIRLKEHDYSANGYYFVTIRADGRMKYFKNETMYRIVVAELALLNERFKGVDVDYFVLMQDHIHIIFVFDDSEAPLSRVVQAFKSITTLKAKQALPLQSLQIGKRLWQKNYYEHIIRNEEALDKIRKYIQNNPEKEILKFGEFYEY